MTPHTYSTLILAAVLCSTAGAEELTSATATTAVVAAKPGAKPLDLRPPNITHLFTSEQLNRIIGATFREDLEEVEVEGARERRPPDTPDVWPGIASLAWAVVNPAEAWRIFAPMPPDRTRAMQNVGFNASDAYVLEPAATSPAQ